MQLTFVNDLGQTFVLEIDPNMELEDVMAILEAESGIPVREQSISYEGRELNNATSSMRDYGVADNAMMLLRRKFTVGERTIEQDSEMMRLQILGDPQLMRQLQETQPEIAAAAQSDPTRFAELLRQTRDRQYQAELARQREIEQLDADPYNVEAQRKIEEAIREQAVLENMEHAIEYAPESFGKVTMLYIPLEVNSKPMKAFVDSGAQQTIMSPSCAELCGLTRLIDQRFSGIARGVGTARILGRVHSAQIKVSDLFLPCSFTIMEGSGVDILFGLDMLKAHQACIDLEKNVLRIRGREVRFLSEHELPEDARSLNSGGGDLPLPANASSPTTGEGVPRLQTSFPGSGNTLGVPPSSRVGAPVAQSSSRPGSSRYSEGAIATLMGLGATREMAISTLDAAGGNLDVAASLLF